MNKRQKLGLGLIVLSGIISQFTSVKQYQTGVWIMALLAMIGAVLVLYDWFKTW